MTISVLALGKKQKKKFPIKDRKKTKRKKFSIKDRKETKKEIPDQRLEEKARE